MTEMILTSSVLILLLAILRRALRGRIDPRVQYALWLLVAARLLIPGTLFDAPVSVAGAAEQLQTSILLAERAEIFPAPFAEEPGLPSDGPTVPFVTQPSNGPAAAFVTQPSNGPTAPFVIKPAEVRQAEKMLELIWKTGMAVMAGVLAVSNLVFYLRLRKNRKLLTLPDALWSGKLPVYAAEGIPSPCLFGLLRPAVYLNEAAMGAEHPEHILVHEYAHYRHGDHVWAILRSVCLAIHWYNPLVWWAAALSRRDCELACDASALGWLGEEARIDYGRTLLGMVSGSRSPAALLHAATTMTAGKRAMTERIALIIKQPKTKKITMFLVILTACLLAACVFGGKAEAEPALTPAEPANVQEPPASGQAEPAGADGTDALETVLARLDELEAKGETIGYTFSSKFGAPANGSYRSEDIIPALRDAFRDCRWTFAEDHPPTEWLAEVEGRRDIRDTPDEVKAQFANWQQVSIGGFTFFDGHPYVFCWTGEDEDGYETNWYYVPEGWITVQAALMNDHYSTGDKYFYLYDEARMIWNSFQYGWLWERYDGKFEDEEGTWLAVGFFESIADMRGYLETLFVPEIAEELLSLYRFCDHDGHLCVLEHDSSDSNPYVGNEIVQRAILSPEMQAEYGCNGIIQPRTPVLGKDLETVLGEKWHSFPYKWNGVHNVFLNFGPCDDVDPQIYYNAEEIAAQVQRGVDAGEWLPLMNYMNWQFVYQAMVNTGEYTDGDLDPILSVMDEIGQYINRQLTAMTPAEYLYVLTATEGLDGAYSEGYAYLVFQMYAANPGQFAHVVLEELPESCRNAVLDFFRFEWRSRREPTADAAPSRKDAIAMLESDLSASRSVGPDETAFGNPGTAAPDGEERVRYDPDYEEAYARYSSEISEFDRWFQGWMDGVPAAPAGAVTYDQTDERSLYQAVSQYLQGHAGNYFGGEFARNVESYDVQVYFAVPAEPGEQFTVSYAVHVAAALVLPDGHVYSSFLDSRELQTVIAPVTMT